MKRSLGASFRFAFEGLVYAWRTQRNLRLHAVAAALVAGAIGALRLAPLEAAVLVLAIAVVVIAELLNTAVEVVVDQAAGPGEHARARAAKDVAAAGVLIAVVGAAVAGAIILLPRVR